MMPLLCAALYQIPVDFPVCSVKIENVQSSKDHLIVNVREDGLQAITIYSLPPAGTPVESLPEGQKIKFPEPTYSLEEEPSQFNSHIYRYGYSSLRTPQSVYDYDMNTGRTVLKKKQPVRTMNLPACFWLLWYFRELLLRLGTWNF